MQEIINLSIEKIQPAPFNPPSRTDKKSISRLKASIARIGIVYPLVVTDDYKLVDGHRRLECAKELEMATVPVIVRAGDQSELFEEINSTGKQLKTADDLFVYMAGGKMSGRSKEPIETLEKMGGRDLLELLADKHMSPKSIVGALSFILLYINKNEPNFKSGDNLFANKTATWIVNHKQHFRARAAIVNRISPNVIISCIENDEPLP